MERSPSWTAWVAMALEMRAWDLLRHLGQQGAADPRRVPRQRQRAGRQRPLPLRGRSQIHHLPPAGQPEAGRLRGAHRHQPQALPPRLRTRQPGGRVPAAGPARRRPAVPQRAVRGQRTHRAHGGPGRGRRRLPGQDSRHPAFRTIGGRIPANCSALGKALLAHGTADTLRAYLGGPLARRTPYSIAEPGRLVNQLRQVPRHRRGVRPRRGPPGADLRRGPGHAPWPPGRGRLHLLADHGVRPGGLRTAAAQGRLRHRPALAG